MKLNLRYPKIVRSLRLWGVYMDKLGRHLRKGLVIVYLSISKNASNYNHDRVKSESIAL